MNKWLLAGIGLLSCVMLAEEKKEKVIQVAMLLDDRPFELMEVGASATATLGDAVVFKVTKKATQATVEDSKWIIESVDRVGQEIKSRHNAFGSLKTQGQYVFVTFSVENLMKTPSFVPLFALSDDKGRRFTSMDYGISRRYLPEEFATVELSIAPGLKRRYCVIFEIPKEAKPSTVELIPLSIGPYVKPLLANGFSGKKVSVSSAEQESNPSAVKTEAEKKNVATAEKPFALTMKCTRGEHEEEKIRRDVTMRTLGYTVELKGANTTQKDVTVKAYFLGEGSGNKLVITDVADETVTINSTKPVIVKVSCEPVFESDKFPRGSVELKGVIIQAWADGKIIQSYTSQYTWKKYADLPDILTKFEKIETRHKPDLPKKFDGRR